MRRLQKGPLPSVLIDNADAWTEEFLNLPTGFSRYRHAGIRKSLSGETLYKCAYCESRVEDVAPIHVEHILPKSCRPELVVAWENLTVACPNCNQYKGSYYSPEQPLLNPYRDEPSEHLVFAGSLLFAAGGSELGERTINRLQLSRTPLNQSREDRLKALARLFQSWFRAGDEDKQMYADLLVEEVGPDREYSEAGRSWLRLMGFTQI